MTFYEPTHADPCMCGAVPRDGTAWWAPGEMLAHLRSAEHLRLLERQTLTTRTEPTPDLEDTDAGTHRPAIRPDAGGGYF